MRTITEINRDTQWAEEAIPISKHSLYRKVAASMQRLPVGRVLEVGCASGRFLEYLRQRGWDVHGLELQPQGRTFLDFFGQRGRNGLANISRLKYGISTAWPYRDENEFVQLSFTRAHYAPTDDRPTW